MTDLEELPRTPDSPPAHTGKTTWTKTQGFPEDYYWDSKLKGWKRKDAMKTQVGGDHYKSLAIEPLEFCQRNELGYAESSAIKYICRHKLKGGREDIEKAIHCLEMLLEIVYEGDTKSSK